MTTQLHNKVLANQIKQQMSFFKLESEHVHVAQNIEN